MSMWLQTRTVRHLVITAASVSALCGAEPRMWFQTPPGIGRFVFSNPRTTAPADLDLPICSKCAHVLTQLTTDNR